MAIANMVLGLKELHIRGEIRTNVDYTVDILHVSGGIVFVSLLLTKGSKVRPANFMHDMHICFSSPFE